MNRKYKLGLVICTIFMFISGCGNQQDQEKANTLKAGLAKLSALSTQDLETVNQVVSEKQAQIKRERRKAQQAENPNQKINYAELFSGTVIMGDSISLGLIEYRLLPEILVVASRGRNVDMIDDDVQKVISLAPTHVFMQYGVNDLNYFRQNTPLFIEKYKGVIKQIQTALPNTKIYVNALLPVQQNAINKSANLAGVPIFNKGLNNMCQELKIPFIDNAHILHDYGIGYNFDGIHPLYDYFPLWLEHMAEVANL